MEGIREIGVLNLDCVAAGGYPHEEVPMLAHGGE